MIAEARETQAGHDGELAHGLTLWLAAIHKGPNENGVIEMPPDAEGAAGIVAETIIMWRAIMKSKFK